MSDTIEPIFNPEGSAGTPEQNEKFVRFLEGVVKLNQEFGYGSFMVTISEPGKDGLVTTGIHAETLVAVEIMRRNAAKTSLAFMLNAAQVGGKVRFD